MGAYLNVYYWAPAAVSVKKKNQRAKTAAGAFHGYTLKTGIHSILVLVWYLIISPAQYFPGIHSVHLHSLLIYYLLISIISYYYSSQNDRNSMFSLIFPLNLIKKYYWTLGFFLFSLFLHNHNIRKLFVH